MFRTLVVAAAILTATAAYAQDKPKPISVEFTLEEVNVTINMIDACVKARGLECSTPANQIVQKLREAAEKSAKK